VPGVLPNQEPVEALSEFAGNILRIVVEVESFEAVFEGIWVGLASAHDGLGLHLVYFPLELLI